METILFFHLNDAIDYCKNVLDLDHSNVKEQYKACEYVPQSVFESITTFHDFQMMRRGLVWLTENDIKKLK